MWSEFWFSYLQCLLFWSMECPVWINDFLLKPFFLISKWFAALTRVNFHFLRSAKAIYCIRSAWCITSRILFTNVKLPLKLQGPRFQNQLLLFFKISGEIVANWCSLLLSTREMPSRVASLYHVIIYRDFASKKKTAGEWRHFRSVDFTRPTRTFTVLVR